MANDTEARIQKQRAFLAQKKKKKEKKKKEKKEKKEKGYL